MVVNEPLVRGLCWVPPLLPDTILTHVSEDGDGGSG